MKMIRLFFLSQLVFSFTCFSQDFGDSGWCQDSHNINDSPWNAAIKNMKDAVFLVLIPFRDNTTQSISYSQCTGTLINQNVNQNYLRQIFVLAKHCVEENGKTLLTNDVNNPWIFYFHYQSPNGENNGVPDIDDLNSSNRDGRRHLFESSVNIIRSITGCDFTMGEILRPIPPHFNVYYQGWSVSLFQGLQLPNYVLHHPKGDIKKWAKTHSTITNTNYSCHIVTEVIDVIYWGLFGWWTGTQINTTRVCNYVESPFWTVPIWSSGVTEPGSSGSGLLNMQQRLIGVLSNGLGSCDFPVGENFGKLSTAVIESPTVKNILEPYNFWAVNGDGRRITCRTDLLDLEGQYFPAKDYQPENKIQLKAANKITTKVNSELNIRTGADFDFIAGNSIRLRAGFKVSANAFFKAKIGDDCAGFTGGRTAVTTEIVKPNFKIGGLKKSSSLENSIFFDVHPNPSQGKINVHLVLPEMQDITEIRIISFDGKVLYAKYLEQVIVLESEIDLSHLSPGIYSIHLSGPKLNLYKKLVITK
jgi:hypothetical protein